MSNFDRYELAAQTSVYQYTKNLSLKWEKADKDLAVARVMVHLLASYKRSRKVSFEELREASWEYLIQSSSTDNAQRKA